MYCSRPGEEVSEDGRGIEDIKKTVFDIGQGSFFYVFILLKYIKKDIIMVELNHR